jgi:hypothetical protein
LFQHRPFVALIVPAMPGNGSIAAVMVVLR